MSNAMRICKRCLQDKPISSYYRDARFADLLDVQCSDCRKARVKRWRDAHPERAKAIALKSRIRNPEAYRARARRWFLANHEKHLAYSARRRKEKPRLVVSGKLKAMHGITLEQYEAIAASQNHACAICGTPQAEQKRKMAVDHHHGTGRIRGLLCHNCNVGIGNLKDSKQILTKALNYIHEHSSHSESRTQDDGIHSVRGGGQDQVVC